MQRLASRLCLSFAAATSMACYATHEPPAAPADAGPLGSADDASPPAEQDDGGTRPLRRAPGAPCTVPPAVDALASPAIEVSWSAPDDRRALSTNVCATPLVVETDPLPEGDVPEPELVFTSYVHGMSGAEIWVPAGPGDVPPPRAEVGVIRIVDPRTGETRRTIPEDPDEPLEIEAAAPLAAADLDGDGVVEIVAIHAVFGSAAYRTDGSRLWTSLEPSMRNRSPWGGEVPLLAASGAPTVADLDADGRPEVILGRVVLNAEDGTTAWVGAGGFGIAGDLFGPISCVVDADADGVLEVVAGNTLYEAVDGAIRWQADVPDGFCAIGEVLAWSEGPEIVLHAQEVIYVLDPADGTVLWQQAVPGAGGALPMGGPPALADTDDDGAAEIAVAAGTRLTLFDPSCGEPACRPAGVRWSAEVEDSSSAVTTPTLFDFEGDGRLEVVHKDQHHLRIFEAQTGALIFRAPSASRTRTENPVIADVDGDGNAELVVASNLEAAFLEIDGDDDRYHAGVEIWGDPGDRWVGAPRQWTQHAFMPRGERNPTTLYRATAIEPAEDARAAPDLVVTMEARCEAGRAVVVVRVENTGDTRVLAGVRVELRADGRTVATAETTRALDPGGWEELRFDGGSMGESSFEVFVDAPDHRPLGRERECDETNNAATARLRCGG